MKWIKYQVVQDTNGEEVILLTKKIGHSEANLAIAQVEAYNGEYTIEEDSKSFDEKPLAIEFGGTDAKTAAEALNKLGAMPKSGGTFTGNAVAATTTDEATVMLRNIVIVEAGTDLTMISVPAGTIIMQKK